MRTTDFELYAFELMKAGFGYPLFEPDPHGDYDRVRTGDVGINFEGKFIRLFNVFYEKAHDIYDQYRDKVRFPDGFVVLRDQECDLSQVTHHNELGKGSYKSRRSIDVDFDVDITGQVIYVDYHALCSYNSFLVVQLSQLEQLLN